MDRKTIPDKRSKKIPVNESIEMYVNYFAVVRELLIISNQLRAFPVRQEVVFNLITLVLIRIREIRCSTEVCAAIEDPKVVASLGLLQEDLDWSHLLGTFPRDK